MYIPRLRRISDVLTAMQQEDPGTFISRAILLELIQKKKISRMKYGNAWLINLDEINAFFSGTKMQSNKRFIVDVEPGRMTKFSTSGEIFRIFKAADPGTIIRRPNLRRFAKDNGVEVYEYPCAWLVHTKQFFKAINPRGLEGRYETPRLRNGKSAVREWNKAHPYCQIDKHVVYTCKDDERVFCYQRERTWVINYDQLEPVIAEYMLTHTYTPQKKR